MIKRIALTIAFLAVGSLALSNGRAETGWEEAFFKANQAYREGRFEEAIDEYLQLIVSGREGGPVYYNLGNAYFKGDRLGYAIWAYEKGLLLTPRDPDLRFNLSHARDRTRDAIGDQRGPVEAVFFWLGSFSLGELFAGFAVFNLIFWSLLLIRLFHRSEWLFYLLLVVVSIWLVSGLSFGLKFYQVAGDDRAVILEKEVDILAGPDPADTVLFKLHEGTVAHHERSEEGWSLIRVSDKNRGWVKEKAIAPISAETPGPQSTG